jgi:multidrug efflux pump subunit AcrB
VILFLFKQFRIALAHFGIAILGTAGSLLALFITNTPLNVGSYTGLIMIVGIIGENAIFTFLQFKQSALESNVNDAIIYSISTRLRPKLMTALGAIIALDAAGIRHWSRRAITSAIGHCGYRRFFSGIAIATDSFTKHAAHFIP